MKNMSKYPISFWNTTGFNKTPAEKIKDWYDLGITIAMAPCELEKKTFKDTVTISMKKAAGLVSQTIKNDGIIYIFGCGHSHLSALDCFYRAGGLANVSAIFI